MSTRIGIIGAGQHAENAIYPSFAEINGCVIAACCDIDKERAGALARKHGVPEIFTDYRAMLEKTDLDAVCVIIPAHLLEEPVIAVLDQGLDIFIEKPPGITAAQTKRWAAIAHKKNSIAMTAFNRRFEPVILEAKRLVEERGPITQALAGYYKNMGAMARNPFEPIDILGSDVIHSVDFLRWTGGDVISMRSDVTQFFQSYDNSFNAIIAFGSGARGILSTNYAAGRRIERFEIHGHGISALIEPPRLARISHNEKEYVLRVEDLVNMNGRDENGVFRLINGFCAETAHFIDCVRTRRNPSCNFDESAHTMELIEAIRANTIK
jgi:predicted dehydrogenase